MKTLFWTAVLFAIALPAWAEAPLQVGKARQIVELTGYTRSRTEVTLSSEVGGKVLVVGYEIGDEVKAAPVVRIDPTFVDFSIAQARRRIEQIVAELARNDSQVDFLRKEFARIDALFRASSASEQRRDQIRQELDQAVFARRSLAAEKAVEQARLEELIERRKRHDIFAPAGWIVTARPVDPGEIVAPGTPLATVGEYGRLVVPLSVTPMELAAIRKLSSPFPVRLDGRPASATIRWVNPEFDEKTRKLAVELAVDRWEGPPRGGLVMTLPVEIPVPGLSVPRAAVVNRFDNPRVRLKGTGEEVPVLVLGETDSHLRIADTPRLSPGMALLPAP